MRKICKKPAFLLIAYSLVNSAEKLLTLPRFTVFLRVYYIFIKFILFPPLNAGCAADRGDFFISAKGADTARKTALHFCKAAARVYTEKSVFWW